MSVTSLRSRQGNKAGLAELLHERVELVLVGDLEQLGVFEHVRPVPRRDEEEVAGAEDLIRLVHVLDADLAGVDVAPVRDRAGGVGEDGDEAVDVGTATPASC